MTRQQRQLLIALLDGPVNTANSFERAGILALSQRAGELERMGLALRGRRKLSESSQPVVEVALTEEGRGVALRLRSGLPAIVPQEKGRLFG